MKKLIAFVLALTCVLALASCNHKEQYFFTGKVIEIHEEYLLLEIFDSGNSNLTEGSKVEVSTSVVSANGCPEFVTDEYARVVMARKPNHNSSMRFETLAIYKADETGAVVSNIENQGQGATYSFSGECEYFIISNGSIILRDTEQKFDGGELTITQSSLFEKVTSCSTCFYTLVNGERDIFHSTNATGLEGGSILDGIKLGKASSNGFLIRNLEQGLWFELKTTDMNGIENVYHTQLIITE